LSGFELILGLILGAEQQINTFLIFLRITYEIKPRIFDGKRGIAALPIKNSGFSLIREPEQENKEANFGDCLEPD